MLESIRIKAKKMMENNFEYLDEVVEAAIINILEDENIDEGSYESVLELQFIYDTYVAGEKYGKKIV